MRQRYRSIYNVMQQLEKIISSLNPFGILSDILPPRFCFGCGHLLKVEYSGNSNTKKRATLRLSPCCDDCAELRLIALRERPTICCSRCGIELADHEQYSNQTTVCIPCSHNRSAIDFSRSIFPYDGRVREILHLLKFQQFHPAADFFAEILALFLRPSLAQFADDAQVRSSVNFRAGSTGEFAERFWDIVVPIPASIESLRTRGLGITSRLARIVAEIIRIRYHPDALQNSRARISQRLLSHQGRKSNVRGAFTAGSLVRTQRVLLIDDIYTTGSTVEAAAQALKIAGAKSVDVVTIAHSERTVSTGPSTGKNFEEWDSL